MHGIQIVFHPSLVYSRIWFWVKSPTNEHSAQFNWSRDSVYGATILLGVGGATIIVLSLTMISQFVGKFAVSTLFCYTVIH